MVKSSNQNYVNIKIPKELADLIDGELVGKWGYTSRAEVCKDGVRNLLRQQLADDQKEAAV